jgi:hypothetical protein
MKIGLIIAFLLILKCFIQTGRIIKYLYILDKNIPSRKWKLKLYGFICLHLIFAISVISIIEKLFSFIPSDTEGFIKLLLFWVLTAIMCTCWRIAFFDLMNDFLKIYKE